MTQSYSNNLKPGMSLAIVAILLLGSLNTFAQLPNADFEVWPVDTFPFSDPENWTSLNEYHYLFGYEEFTVEQSTSAFTGNYSLNVTTRKFCNSTPFDYCFLVPGQVVVGDMIVNPADLSLITFGIDYTERPESLSGMFKYLPILEDSFKITVTLTRRDLESGNREVVGEAKWVSGDSIAQFTPFDMPITYYTEEIPDKLKIFIYSGHINKVYNQPYPIGSSLHLDNLHLGAPWNPPVTSIDEIDAQATEMSLYPNPATDAVTVRFSGLADEQYSFEITDLLGRTVKDAMVAPYYGNSRLDIDVTELASGSYLVLAKDSDGSIRATEKLAISH